MAITRASTPVYTTAMPSTQRVLRRPSHTFHLRHKPFTIQPFLLAPVLPGETMKNCLIQSRAVSDPIKNPLTGWWLEYYLFYVKHRDLDERDTLTALQLNPATDVAALREDAQRYDLYQPLTGFKWSEMCLKRVVEEYFRDEGESWTISTVDGLPAASIKGNSWLDSATDVTTMPDVDVDVEAGTPDTVPLDQLDQAYMQYEHLRALKMVNMSYEDWLRTFGVRLGAVELHRPELLRFISEWQYPTNTVDPSNGTPRSAVSWAIAERADKDRFFTEPGFIFGVTCARPKVYMRTQKGSAASFMDSALSWLPAIMHDSPHTSLQELDNGDDLITTTNAFIFDVRDILVHGDQFINFNHSADLTVPTVNLPNAGLTNKRYPSEDDAEDLFIDDDDSDGLTKIRQDGIVNLTIAGRQVDNT